MPRHRPQSIGAPLAQNRLCDDGENPTHGVVAGACDDTPATDGVALAQVPHNRAELAPRLRCAAPRASNRTRTIATVTTYDGLVDAIRRRIEQIGVPLETIDLHVGLADRHCGKLLSPSRIRAFGPKSFDLMMAGLGLRLVVHGDAETPALIRKRFGGYTSEGTSLRAIRRRRGKEGRE